MLVPASLTTRCALIALISCVGPDAGEKGRLGSGIMRVRAILFAAALMLVPLGAPGPTHEISAISAQRVVSEAGTSMQARRTHF
jgi:hypothetical protein